MGCVEVEGAILASAASIRALSCSPCEGWGSAGELLEGDRAVSALPRPTKEDMPQLQKRGGGERKSRSSATGIHQVGTPEAVEALLHALKALGTLTVFFNLGCRVPEMNAEGPAEPAATS